MTVRSPRAAWAMGVAAAAAFCVDQASKVAVVRLLSLPERGHVDVISPLLSFRYGENRGVNFGILDIDSELVRWGLVAATAAICAVLWFWLRGSRATGARATAFAACGGMLIGGALGNAVDRIALGYVVDFLNMSCCGIRNPYVFNLADVFIFAGVAGILVIDWRDRGTERAG